jgi:hypothetical protein
MNNSREKVGGWSVKERISAEKEAARKLLLL